jgi:hypothetical protein
MLDGTCDLSVLLEAACMIQQGIHAFDESSERYSLALPLGGMLY